MRGESLIAVLGFLREEKSSFVPDSLSHKSSLNYQGLRFSRLFTRTPKMEAIYLFFPKLFHAENFDAC